MKKLSDATVVLSTTWTADPGDLDGVPRRVYDFAIAAGWKVPGVRRSRWTKRGVEHASAGFGLVDPSDGHREADAVWTDGKWDNGAHHRAGYLSTRIGFRAFNALAKLPPGRYVDEEGDDDDVQSTEREPLRPADLGS